MAKLPTEYSPSMTRRVRISGCNSKLVGVASPSLSLPGLPMTSADVLRVSIRRVVSVCIRDGFDVSDDVCSSADATVVAGAMLALQPPLAWPSLASSNEWHHAPFILFEV